MGIEKASQWTYPNKRGKFRVLEKLRNDLLLELDGVLHDKGFSVIRPACNGRIASVHHVKGFCKATGRTQSNDNE